MRLTGTRLVLCLAVFAALFGLAGSASADCYGICVKVGPLCRQCQDSPTPTGALCASNGPCSCYYIQCAAAQSAQTQTQKSLTEIGLGAPTLAPAAACLNADVAPPMAAN